MDSCRSTRTACVYRSLDNPICPQKRRRPHSQTYRRRGFFAFAFAARLVARFDSGGGAASYFLTSSTTSCHQCSACPFSNPSSRPRVAAKFRSWCHSSQAARVFHVPTITRRSGLSDCRRSCPPTQPGRFFAADRRVRIAASHSGPAPSFRCTCVTIVIIELVLLGPKSSVILSVSLDHLICSQQERQRDRQTEGLGGLEVNHQLELAWLRDGQVGRLRILDPVGHGSPLPHFLLRLAI